MGQMVLKLCDWQIQTVNSSGKAEIACLPLNFSECSLGNIASGYQQISNSSRFIDSPLIASRKLNLF